MPSREVDGAQPIRKTSRSQQRMRPGRARWRPRCRWGPRWRSWRPSASRRQRHHRMRRAPRRGARWRAGGRGAGRFAGSSSRALCREPAIRAGEPPRSRRPGSPGSSCQRTAGRRFHAGPRHGAVRNLREPQRSAARGRTPERGRDHDDPRAPERRDIGRADGARSSAVRGSGHIRIQPEGVVREHQARDPRRRRGRWPGGLRADPSRLRRRASRYLEPARERDPPAGHQGQPARQVEILRQEARPPSAGATSSSRRITMPLPRNAEQPPLTHRPRWIAPSRVCASSWTRADRRAPAPSTRRRACTAGSRRPGAPRRVAGSRRRRARRRRGRRSFHGRSRAAGMPAPRPSRRGSTAPRAAPPG